MSLQSTLNNQSETAVRLRAGSFAFTVRRMIAPLLLQITSNRQARLITDNRRKAALEIDALPPSLSGQNNSDSAKPLKTKPPTKKNRFSSVR